MEEVDREGDLKLKGDAQTCSSKAGLGLFLKVSSKF